MTKSLLVITLGDPFSINIEAVDKIIATETSGVPTLLIGSRTHWEAQASRVKNLKFLDSLTLMVDGLCFYNVDHVLTPGIDPFDPNARGLIAAESLYTLRQLSPQKKLAVLTCPIDKHVASQAGFHFPGQTEFFSHLWQAEALMILAGPKLRVGLTTNHLPLSEVASTITEDLVYKKICSFSRYLKTVSKNPKMAIVGLNPHASDHGLFGDEERKTISPAISRARATDLGCKLYGPLPADTAFFHCLNGEYDGVLAMYHDQGLGPLKTAHFYDAVNISWGLKHFRVSPDHGPAQDHFGKNSARLDSFLHSYKQCLNYLSS